MDHLANEKSFPFPPAISDEIRRLVIKKFKHIGLPMPNSVAFIHFELQKLSLKFRFQIVPFGRAKTYTDRPNEFKLPKFNLVTSWNFHFLAVVSKKTEAM
jgi:hypothetical protein